MVKEEKKRKIMGPRTVFLVHLWKHECTDDVKSFYSLIL